jgi:hypothetical protein
MLRSLRAVACAVVVFVAGCKAEVKEVPPADEKTTPTMSAEERQQYDAAQKKVAEKAASTKRELEGKAGKKSGDKKN